MMQKHSILPPQSPLRGAGGGCWGVSPPFNAGEITRRRGVAAGEHPSHRRLE